MLVTRSVIEYSKKADTALRHLSKPYSFCFVREQGGGFSAYVREFQGCYSQGDSLEEAYQNLNEAAMNWLIAVIDLGQPIPEPIERLHP